MDLSRRERIPELMDDPALDPHLHEQALRGLWRINRLSGSARILWPPLAALASKLQRPLRVLDIATGGGDVLIALARKCRGHRISLDLAGCDISPQALAIAAERAGRSRVPVRFFRLDALTEPLPTDYDVIMCSLFLHHLSDEQALTVLSRAGQAAKQAVLVNDLLRSTAGYWLARIGTRILSRSPIVHIDGPLSVRAAYNEPEVRRLAMAAGLAEARIERRWPCRFLLTWIRP